MTMHMTSYEKPHMNGCTGNFPDTYVVVNTLTAKPAMGTHRTGGIFTTKTKGSATQRANRMNLREAGHYYDKPKDPVPEIWQVFKLKQLIFNSVG